MVGHVIEHAASDRNIARLLTYQANEFRALLLTNFMLAFPDEFDPNRYPLLPWIFSALLLLSTPVKNGAILAGVGRSQ